MPLPFAFFMLVFPICLSKEAIERERLKTHPAAVAVAAAARVLSHTS
jgi:hypothetical protein